MQKLRDYYKKLDALIGDIRIFHEEEEQNLKNREKMHREVIPLLAYILASCRESMTGLTGFTSPIVSTTRKPKSFIRNTV